MEEKLSASSLRHPRFSKCCGLRKVVLPKLSGQFPELHRLLDDQGSKGKTFRADRQKYNNVFAFTSIGMKQDMDTWGNRGIYNLRVSGRVTHRMRYLHRADGEVHRFAQIYMLDNEAAVENRLNQILRFGNTAIGLDKSIVQDFQLFLSEHNYYALTHERFLQNPNATVLSIRQILGGPDLCRYDMPTDNTEIAAVIIKNSDAQDRGRDLWVHIRGAGTAYQVSELHKTFLPLHFPLIHP